MYRIIKARGYDGTNKLDIIAATHSLEGEFYIEPRMGEHICFIYNDDSGKMLRSSTIYDVKHVDNQIWVETRNSEYWFEKVEV